MNNPTQPGILCAKSIKKSFRSPDGGSVEVLGRVDLEVPSGHSVSLVGESGAGKTTLLNILAGFELPDDGSVLWDGVRIDKFSNSQQARRRAGFMGFVFQNYCLVPELNAVENVELAARIAGKFGKSARERARELLDAVGLGGRMKHLPSQLSGGEKQRVAIARAIMNSPRIVLSDEPTGNLDEKTGESVMNMFFKLCSEREVALLLITHNQDFASRCDSTLHLSAGKISK